MPGSAGGDLRFPDIAVIGAAKSGTSALFYCLRSHPLVFAPRHEEPSYFAFAKQEPCFEGPPGVYVADNHYPVTSRERYEALFADSQKKVTLDVSPAYLYWPGTAEKLRAARPDVKIVAVLRNPVDRAFSGFLHARREGREPIHDFMAAVRAEPRRIADGWGLLWRYVDQGFYARQLARYFAVFASDSLLVLLYDDLQRDPAGTLRRILEFAGLPPADIDLNTRHNVSGIPRRRWIHQILMHRLVRAPELAFEQLGRSDRLRRARLGLVGANLERPRLSADDRQWLLDYFRHDIAELESMLERDLSDWRTVGIRQ